jgi:hypothetical protein
LPCINLAVFIPGMGEVGTEGGYPTYQERYYTDKKENTIFLIYKEIQSGSEQWQSHI